MIKLSKFLLVLSASVFMLQAAEKERISPVDSIYARLTLEEKIGQILMPVIYSAYAAEGMERTRGWQEAIDSAHVGGFIVFRGDVTEQWQLSKRMQRRSKLPLLLAADYENGTGTVCEDGTHFVTALGIGATGNPENAYEMGRITALEARSIGIHLVFAPVADVNSNPDNLIINYRAYGDNPLKVSRYVTSFIKGVQENGAIAVAKHFPGHGDVMNDSHLQLVVQRKSRGEWMLEELPPFKAAIDSGVGGIMTAHIAFPALTGDTLTPATLSRKILTDILQDELGFDGLIITDALMMGGILNQYWSGESALRAFLAGADILLMPKNLHSTVKYLLTAVEDGRISSQRLEKSVKKILLAKWRLGLFSNPLSSGELWRHTALPENLNKADSISSLALTLVRLKDFKLPMDPNSKTEVVIFSNDETGTEALEEFVASMRGRLRDVSFSAIDRRTNDDEYDAIEDRLDEAERIIFAVKVPIHAFSGSASLEERQQEYFSELAEDYPQALTVVFGNPYFLREAPQLRNSLLTYTWSKLIQRIAAASLNGVYAISGKLPVNIPGVAEEGSGVYIPKRSTGLNFSPLEMPEIDKMVEKAIRDSVFPGCQLVVGRKGKIVFDKSYGFHTYAREIFVSPANQYDLASVTKVLATTLSLMKLYDRGEMRPEYTLDQFFPGLDEAKKHITLEQLLTHTSGFVKWKPFYKELSGRKAIVNKILTDTLEYVPGTKYEYSDLNFILLREIVEKLAGMPIEEFLQKEFYGPLGLYSITYLPKDSNNCIPTEIVSGKVIHGFVQDENAHAMGGISGHAGLFSSAEDIAVIAEMLLNGGVYNGKRYLKKETIEFFRKRRFDRPHWTHALGWDTPSLEKSLVGDEFPRTSIGHWGFSGTSVWMDFEDDIFVVLLTNRTYPDRSNKKISDFRPRLHDALYRELTEDD